MDYDQITVEYLESQLKTCGKGYFLVDDDKNLLGYVAWEKYAIKEG